MSETLEKRKYGSGSGASDLYIVEARTTNGDLRTIAGNRLSPEWRRVHFVKGAVGIPSFTYVPIDSNHVDMYTYEAALALAHWFLTMPDETRQGEAFIGWHCLCVDARLVKVRLTYSYSTEEQGVGEAFNHSDMQRAAKFVERT